VEELKTLARKMAEEEHKNKQTGIKPVTKKRKWSIVTKEQNRNKYWTYKAKMERLGKWFICPSPGCDFVSIACN
jgi:hypothetical protein